MLDISSSRILLTLRRVCDSKGCLKFVLISRLISEKWLNTVLRAVSRNSRNDACFKLDKQNKTKATVHRGRFSKSTH